MILEAGGRAMLGGPAVKGSGSADATDSDHAMMGH